jgi:hypothetical protein
VAFFAANGEQSAADQPLQMMRRVSGRYTVHPPHGTVPLLAKFRRLQIQCGDQIVGSETVGICFEIRSDPDEPGNRRKFDTPGFYGDQTLGVDLGRS